MARKPKDAETPPATAETPKPAKPAKDKPAREAKPKPVPTVVETEPAAKGGT